MTVDHMIRDRLEVQQGDITLLYVDAIVRVVFVLFSESNRLFYQNCLANSFI